MDVSKIAVNAFAKFILGGLAWEKIKHVVQIYSEANDLTGDQKREAAIKDIKDIGVGLGKTLINLGIELAVLFLKSKGVIK